MCPIQHVLRKPFIEEFTLVEEGDHAVAEVLTELGDIEGGYIADAIWDRLLRHGGYPGVFPLASSLICIPEAGSCGSNAGAS